MTFNDIHGLIKNALIDFDENVEDAVENDCIDDLEYAVVTLKEAMGNIEEKIGNIKDNNEEEDV